MKWDFDVFGVAETNLDWRLCKEEEKLPLRTKEWWDHQHVSWTFNSNAPPTEPRQYGGTAVFSNNQAAHRVISSGFDKSNLGRWAWTRYKGRGSSTLRIISAYRPNPPTGPKSVYAQHNVYFLSKGVNQCPRKSFLEDLQKDLTEFMESGDQLILMLDGNCNMRDSDLQKMLMELTLHEIIINKHGNLGPATSKRNFSSIPIDGIWTTPGIIMEAGGYFKFDEVFINTDHRCLWIDIHFVNAFGHNMPPLFRPKAKRLHCRDPRLVNNFISLYHQHADWHGLFKRVKDFESNNRTMSSEEVQLEYEKIDDLFSPALNEARLVIKAWSLLLQRAKGQKISSRLISQTLKKVNLPPNTRGLSSEAISEHLKNAYKEYYLIKGEAKELQNTALENLALALAEKGNLTQSKMLADLRRREAQRTTARKLKYLRGKLRTGSTTIVTVTNDDGKTREITDKAEMERAILHSNNKKFSQSTHTPFYQSPLREAFGFKGLSTASQAVLAGVYDPPDKLNAYILDVLEEWKNQHLYKLWNL